MIDLIIPTIPGREESLERCVSSYLDNAAGQTNQIVVRDSITCGWGWKQGLELSKAEYVLLACDDQQCIGQGWDEKAIEAVEAGYIACPRVWLPDNKIESNGGDMNAYCHVISRPQKDWKPVDYTTVPFLSRQAMDQIGMIPVHYASDVWVSYRGRQLGIETVLRHGFDLMHHQELIGRGAGMSQGDRDELDCKTVYKELERLEREGAVA